MALRTIKIAVVSIALLVLLVPCAQACFGPKLFVGAGQSTKEKLLYALVTLYVEEKTGVESTYVELEQGQEPISLLTADKADLVFAQQVPAGQQVVFSIEGFPGIVTGKRPIDDLQFTTVLPAIRKLERLIQDGDLESLTARVDAGDSAMSVVRKFLMERRWI